MKKIYLITVLLALIVGAFLAYSEYSKHVRIFYNDYGIQDVEYKGRKYFVTREFDDGPYLIKQGHTLTNYMIKRGKLHLSEQNAAQKYPMEYAVNEVDSFVNVQKIAALSDLHGQFNIVEQLFTANGIIDEKHNWAFGDGHLVITGDLLDKGDAVTETLWLIYELERQAEQAGGKVHYLLGNHEFMVLRGDYGFLHPKYVATMGLIGRDMQNLFGEDTVLGQWLRSKSTIIKINDIVFVHAGIHQDYLDLALPMEQSNAVFRKSIGIKESELRTDSMLTVLHGNTGPIWYRGFLRGKELDQAQVEHVLEQLNASYIAFGHTSVNQVETRFNNKVIAIDTAIKRGEKGELLIWQDNRFWSGDMRGKQTHLF